MAQEAPQNLANHTRFDPLFHFFTLPVFGITWIISVVMLFLHPGFFSAWGVVLATAATIAVFKIRLYATKLQDRIIRLEERLRLLALMSPASQAQIEKLSIGQLVGLRFAGDEEVPALVQRALTENLSRREIKKAIKIWRGDYSRV